MTFKKFFSTAAGQRDIEPWPWQERIAVEGLPDLLDVPTGTGKTAGMVLGWLYRRTAHPDTAVRESTPRRLVFTLPTRVLVEQVTGNVRSWLANLGLTKTVDQRVLLGGADRSVNDWRLEPSKDLIVIGTLDMVLSRALNRGFGVSRWTWPIDFGLLHADCHYVFDEVQLMGPALETSRQLEGFRRNFGTAADCGSTWMSATVDPARLNTIDAPALDRIVQLSAEDVDPRSASSTAARDRSRRLHATRTVHEIELSDKHRIEDLAEAMATQHAPGTRTLAILNTVDAARQLYNALQAELDAQVLLLHSRFRPGDRARVVREALADVAPNGTGTVVVSTQVVEAGVDITSALMFTEAAPWPSVVQRTGRCNRDGLNPGATVLWAPPIKFLPYIEADVNATVEALRALEGQTITSGLFRKRDAAVTPVAHPVLRRRDLLDLFDTTPDLEGNDLDVGMYLRDADDLDVQVCWREISEDQRGPLQKAVAGATPGRHELCPVPVAEMREVLRRNPRPRCWRFDHLDDQWTIVDAASVRPGQVLLLATTAGCYKPDTGWDKDSRDVVAAVMEAPGAGEGPGGAADVDEAVGDDPASYMRRWIGLRQHLGDVGTEVRQLRENVGSALGDHLLDAAGLAGDLHDLGKAHPVFQATMTRCASEEDRDDVAARGPWAKSGGDKRARHKRRYFRHELVSALALVGDGRSVLDGCLEPALVVYLVGAHHGRVRMGIRSLPDEEEKLHFELSGRRVALGVAEGDELPAVELPHGRTPAMAVSLEPMELGRRADGSPSWSEMALGLRDRDDLGPFRLAYLEALVRLADWRVSARYDQATPSPEDQP